jgi:O-antigen biosynthesis protein
MNVSIVIPVHNGGIGVVRRCIESVLRNTPENVSIHVVDDCSDEIAVVDYLRKIGIDTRVQVHKQLGSPRGFVRTVNAALRRVLLGDVIVLNSDTEVPPRWVTRLQSAAYSRADVAAVCPVSNEATVFSVPNAGSNRLPAWLTTEQADAIALDTAPHDPIEVPTAMGFCMYLMRAALRAVGDLSEEFGAGYGEEVDWCLRARALGFVCLLCPSLFVRHVGQASFGTSAGACAEREQGVSWLDTKWPSYKADIKKWLLSGKLAAMRVAFANRLRPHAEGERVVVHVVHNYGTDAGGVEVWTRRTILRAGPEFSNVVLYVARHPFGSDTHVHTDEDGTLCVAMNPELAEPSVLLEGAAFQTRAPRVEKWFREVLSVLNPEMVVFGHLMGWGTLVLPAIARAQCEVATIAHDEWALCPLLRLGGACTKKCMGPDCVDCVRQRGHFLHSVPDSSLLDVIRNCARIIRDAFAVDREVTFPSCSLADRFVETGIVDRSAVSIEPELWQSSPLRAPSVRVPASDKLRVAWVGAARDDKGWEAFADFARWHGHQYEISVLGPVDPRACVAGLEHVCFCGAYKADELQSWLQQFDVLVPAIKRTEAYGMVVDECIESCALVALPDLPILRERIKGAAGWYTWGDVASLAVAVRSCGVCVH